MNTAVVTPLDVKLMNMTATVLLLVFVVLGLTDVVRWTARWSGFDIAAISVGGQVTHNNALTLRANVAPRMAGTFFSVDLARVRAAFESVPWVRRAVVRRQFPNRLSVVLQEHQAVAYWGAERESLLINSYGEVFEANVGEIEQDQLPRLLGPEGQSAEVLAMHRALLPLFVGMDMAVDQLELSGRGNWRVRLESGAVIELGRGSTDEVGARLHRFLKTLTQITARYGRQVSALELADLRHENGYALRLRGVSTLAADGPQK
jgi:cell division protein FtsQ